MKVLDLNYLAKAPPGIIFVPFVKYHAKQMTLQQSDVLAFGDTINIADRLAEQAAAGIAVTVLKNKHPIAIWGSYQLWNGVEEAWLITEEVTRSYAVSLCKVAKLYFSLRFQEASLHRLQITVRCEDNRAVRWAKWLGFQVEGTMRGYYPDQSDAYLMSMLNGE